MTGTVTLVGAGPGDPGLLTLSALEAITAARAVVYDRLVDPAVLALIPPEAEKVDAGKEASHHLKSQDEINEILLKFALEGKDTVRLKGGDPFLFGRGGEEMEFLTARGVPCREIPGITSAVAVPAYAGIPVTHRDFASSLHVITGHARKGQVPDIDFSALVRCGGTIVFLMTVTSLDMICRGLLDAGLAPDTPAAVIQSGTTPGQRKIVATAGTLAEAAREAGIQSPAVSVFGGVCSLSDRLDWYDDLPLRGISVAVTRPADRARALSEPLLKLGADVLEVPCIRTEPILPCPEAERAVLNIKEYEWLVFTSAAGAGALKDCLERMKLDARALGGVKLAAVGPGTAAALGVLGLRPDLVPETYDTAGLGVKLAAAAEGKVLLLRAENGSPDLTAALADAGVPFDDVPVYRTIVRAEECPELIKRLEAGKLTLASFASASAVRGFLAAAGGAERVAGLKAACIGEKTAAEAGKVGMDVFTAEEATLDGLISAVLEICREDF
ncbi:MAG: uroporphyrinogen-III C-methyltransferase [Oscillospiraceae bacterium]|nr:uroporphyrinogen-III C-methyltransferase [Oscillospiraceae bacterium]